MVAIVNLIKIFLEILFGVKYAQFSVSFDGGV